MIIWTKEFETGVAQLDLQHRLLLDNINLLEDQLHTTNPTRGEVEFVAQLLDYLSAYADTHFNIEEKCMASHRCPAHAKNRQDHERFRGFINEYKEATALEGFRIELLRKLHEVICSWIKEHILKIDTQLKPCLKN